MSAVVQIVLALEGALLAADLADTVEWIADDEILRTSIGHSRSELARWSSLGSNTHLAWAIVATEIGWVSW